MKRLTKNLREKIISLYHQGKTISQISEILHIAEVMIVRVVHPQY